MNGITLYVPTCSSSCKKKDIRMDLTEKNISVSTGLKSLKIDSSGVQ